ncbi:OLC1v1022995C1 [Oldenlandia corymbosa var. corymbosa]|uniref:OLC1v1022995C1 n=1 Tax=Oldenlandia corymbosa var. corymbosa TaxID=529605 RepID=A0AAV1BZQ8_OLDCO|nr:OLC1v1022995C1 [Oldenlandia corymbosa var. corymbosa]
MAASVLKATSYDHNTNHLMLSEDHHHHHHPPPLPQHLQPNHNLHLHYTTKTTKQSNFSTARGIARKKVLKANDQGKPKQRKRGMGMVQLERERLKLGVPPSSSEVPPPSSSSPPSPGVSIAVIPAASLGQDSTVLQSTVPLHLAAKYGAFGYSTNNVSTGVIGLPSNHQQATALWIPGVGLFHGQGQLVPDVNIHRSSYCVPNGSEASKELSSTPNVMNSYPDRCSFCQKKRNYEGQTVMCKRAKDMNPGMPTSGSVGYNVGNRQNNQERTPQAFGKIASFSAGGTYFASHTDKGMVDGVNVQRKLGGSSRVGGTGSCIMEYEFFPAYGKNSEMDSDEKGLMMIKKLALGDGSEFSSPVASLMMSGGGDTASCVTTRTTSSGGAGFVGATSPIDLSLKLSY